MTIIEELKTLLEIDIDEELFDHQILLQANAGLRYLMNNAIPVFLIDETNSGDDFDKLQAGDYQLVLNWLHLYCLQRLDRTLNYSTLGAKTTGNWIEDEKTDLIYQLKVRYDVGEFDNANGQVLSERLDNVERAISEINDNTVNVEDML